MSFISINDSVCSFVITSDDTDPQNTEMGGMSGIANQESGEEGSEQGSEAHSSALNWPRLSPKGGESQDYDTWMLYCILSHCKTEQISSDHPNHLLWICNISELLVASASQTECHWWVIQSFIGNILLWASVSHTWWANHTHNRSEC